MSETLARDAALLDGRGRQWPCKEASRRLERLIASRPVTCRGRDRDDYARLLAVCNAGSRELNASLVRDGLTWAFVRYSRDYEKAEAEARAAKRGVFTAENTPPWDFRAGNWEGARKTVEAEKARPCPIKGNVSAKGERIYHLPWQHDYARTKVNERTGERWFCSEGEAERAGWRRAGR